MANFSAALYKECYKVSSQFCIRCQNGRGKTIHGCNNFKTLQMDGVPLVKRALMIMILKYNE